MLKALATLQTKADSFLSKLKKDEEGASLIEYTVLIGLITIAVIAFISAVGGKIVQRWDALNTAFT